MRVLLLLAAAAAVASGQTAEEIVRSTADTYQSLKTYRFEAQVVTEGAPGSAVMRTVETRIAAARLPDRRHIESRTNRGGILRIYDGQTVWDFHSQPNQFSRAEQATFRPRVTLVSDPVETYKILNKGAAQAKLAREETIEIAGTRRSCWIVEMPFLFPNGDTMPGAPAISYWIDKSTHLVLKELRSIRSATITMTYTVTNIDGPLPDELFQFPLPEGASEVAEFTMPNGPGQPLPNTSSPDFTLKNLEGEAVTWGSLKGKPVLVIFWATWCEPCKAEMPGIEEAYRLFREKGLEVVAINAGEKSGTARKYIEDNGYTFRVLLDGDGTVQKKYLVAGLPAMFLIDRDGNLRERITGYGANRDLKNDLKKIGVE